MFHVSTVGFIPGCRIVGVSLDDVDVDGFRRLARAALDEFSSRKITARDWESFSRALDYVPLAAGAQAVKAAVPRAEQTFGGESRRLHYLSTPPTPAPPAVRMLAAAGVADRGWSAVEQPGRPSR